MVYLKNIACFISIAAKGMHFVIENFLFYTYIIYIRRSSRGYTIFYTIENVYIMYKGNTFPTYTYIYAKNIYMCACGAKNKKIKETGIFHS